MGCDRPKSGLAPAPLKAPTTPPSVVRDTALSAPAPDSTNPTPSAKAPAEIATTGPNIEVVDLTKDSAAAAGAPIQAQQVKITRKSDGSEHERAYLDKSGREIRTVRKTEDGVLDVIRTFDESGNVVREETRLNGIEQSAQRKAAK